MWSDRHHSYLKRDSRGSGSSLPPLPQLLAWDRLRLCGLGKAQFKAQNHVGKMLPCWGILLLPFVLIVQAGSCWEGRTSRLCPVLGGLPWSVARCSRHTPLAVPLMFVWAGPALRGAVNSFPPCGPNLPHLSLCPFKQETAGCSL